jgi:hypothetical protein
MSTPLLSLTDDDIDIAALPVAVMQARIHSALPRSTT